MKFNSGIIGLHRFGLPSFLAKPSQISGPASHCPGETKTYSVTPDPAATLGYQWVLPGSNWSIVGPANGNSVQIKFTGNLGGQIRVVAKNANGTSSVSYINVPNTTNPPSVTSTGFVCPTGGSVNLVASGSTDGNYRWYADSTTTFPLVNAFNDTLVVNSISTTTRFFVSIIGANGCETERKGVNARFGKAVPQIKGLPANGPPFTALQAFPTTVPQGVTRSWKKNGVAIGSSTVVGLTGEGIYTLCFTNACGDSCVDYVVTSISKQLKNLDVKIAPNPTDGNLTVYLNEGNSKDLQFNVFDVMGRQISVVAATGNKDIFVLETNSLKPGVYFLNVRSQNQDARLRFIKQ